MTEVDKHTEEKTSVTNNQNEPSWRKSMSMWRSKLPSQTSKTGLHDGSLWACGDQNFRLKHRKRAFMTEVCDLASEAEVEGYVCERVYIKTSVSNSEKRTIINPLNGLQILKISIFLPE